jgi:hypothetical protein
VRRPRNFPAVSNFFIHSRVVISGGLLYRVGQEKMRLLQMRQEGEASVQYPSPSPCTSLSLLIMPPSSAHSRGHPWLWPTMAYSGDVPRIWATLIPASRWTKLGPHSHS